MRRENSCCTCTECCCSRSDRPRRRPAGSWRRGARHPGQSRWAQLLARIYGVFALQCSRCGGRVHLVGFITEPTPVRQILKYVGERTTAPAIAPARSQPLAMNGQQLAAPERVFEAIPELELDQTANLAAEGGHDLGTRRTGAAKRMGRCGSDAGWVRRVAGSQFCTPKVSRIAYVQRINII